jgi:hypothetical protein
LSAKDFLIAVYNSLGVGSDYRSDLVDLFGTPDSSKKGYIGTIDRPIRWDWGETGFRKIINIIYVLSGQDPESFGSFFASQIQRKQKIVQSLVANRIIDDFPYMLYVFKHSLKKIPAFIARIDDISWIERRIWITYQPQSYMLLDPSTWKEFWEKLFTKGREDPEKWSDTWEHSWNKPRLSLALIQQMLHSGFSQDQYHILPTRLLIKHIQKKMDPASNQSRTCFMKNVTKTERRLKLRVPTDNQTFWGILSEFIGKTQVRGTVSFRHSGKTYEIRDIPSNTISEDSLVFKQEIGAARTICQAMLDVFNSEYVNIEFSGSLNKSILDSIFIKRAVKVSTVAKNYEKKYGETDFDYQLDLNPLSARFPNLKSKILFDLTAGLWNKSIAKDKEEFLEQWEHNFIKLPETNPDLCVFWHYGLSSEIRDGSYKGLEVGDYLLSKTKIDAIRYQPGSIKHSKILPKLVLLPFFRDADVRLEKELDWISSTQESMRRKSMLYGALRELLARML